MTTKRQENDLSRLWRHRPGREVTATIEDVFRATYKEYRPAIIKEHFNETDSKYWYMLHLPPGRGYSEFKQKCETLIGDAIKGNAYIERNGARITLEVWQLHLKSMYRLVPWWAGNENYSKLFVPVHFGFSAMGPIVKDLKEMPHLLISGSTGGGKSTFIWQLILSLRAARPNTVLPVVIDLKQTEFVDLAKHMPVITNKKQVHAMLKRMIAEMIRRQKIFAKVGIRKLENYQGKEPLPWIVLIVDELARLQELDNCQDLLQEILQLGRAFGFCCILSTQRPSSTLYQRTGKWGDSKSQLEGRLCYKMNERVDSEMVIGTDRAWLLPSVKGRAVFSWDVETEVQSFFIDPDHEHKKIAEFLGDPVSEVNIFGNDQLADRAEPRQAHIVRGGEV